LKKFGFIGWGETLRYYNISRSLFMPRCGCTPYSETFLIFNSRGTKEHKEFKLEIEDKVTSRWKINTKYAHDSAHRLIAFATRIKKELCRKI
jgi:hypothetical protein